MIKIVKKTGIQVGDKLFIPCEYDAVYPAMVDGQESQELFITEKDASKGIIKILYTEKGPTSYRPIKCSFSSVSDFVYGTAIVSSADEKTGSRFGLINEELDYVLSMQYEGISRISDKIFTVKKNGLYGVYDLEKKEIIVPCKFKEIQYVSPSKQKYSEVSYITLKV